MKKLLISSQAWYHPECESCEEFKKLTVGDPGLNAIIAWCERLELGKSCLRDEENEC